MPTPEVLAASPSPAKLSPIGVVETMLMEKSMDERIRLKVSLDLATAYHHAGETSHSEQILERLEREFPKDSDDLASAWAELDRVEEVLRLASAKPQMAYFPAQKLSGQDKILVLQLAESAHQGRPSSIARLARAYVEAGAPERAKKMVDQFLSEPVQPPEDPFALEPITDIAYTCFKLGKESEASTLVELTREAIPKMPPDLQSSSWATLARASASMDSEKEARKSLVKAEETLKSASGSSATFAVAVIAEVWAKLGEEGKAISILSQAPDPRDGLARVAPHFRDSETLFIAAEEILGGQLALADPGYSTTTYQPLIESQVRLGNRDRAMTHLVSSYQLISKLPFERRAAYLSSAAVVASKHSLDIKPATLESVLHR